MSRKLAASFVFVIALSCASGTRAADLDLTVNLLTAKPGSWTRRYLPHGHSETWRVAKVAKDGVTLQFIRAHEGKIEENKLFDIPAERIRREGINPNAPGARSDRIEHKGKTYDVRVVDADGKRFYLSPAVPASGILRVDLQPGSNPTILWTDEFGDTPDELIRKAGPGSGN